MQDGIWSLVSVGRWSLDGMVIGNFNGLGCYLWADGFCVSRLIESLFKEVCESGKLIGK